MKIDLGPSSPVEHLALDMVGERIIPCPEGVLVVPSHPHEQIEWRARTGGELRVVVDQKVRVAMVPSSSSEHSIVIIISR